MATAHSGSPCTLRAGQGDCANHYSLGYGGRERPCFLAALLRLAVQTPSQSPAPPSCMSTWGSAVRRLAWAGALHSPSLLVCRQRRLPLGPFSGEFSKAGRAKPLPTQAFQKGARSSTLVCLAPKLQLSLPHWPAWEGQPTGILCQVHGERLGPCSGRSPGFIGEQVGAAEPGHKPEGDTPLSGDPWEIAEGAGTPGP